VHAAREQLAGGRMHFWASKGATLALSFLVAVSLSGCATPAQVSAMVVTPSTSIEPSAQFRAAIQVNPVSGGKGTNPLWTSEVGNPEFEAALRQSLSAYGMLAADAPRLLLDAALLSVDQPLMGFEMKVKSIVSYKVSERGTGKVVFEEAITAEYTAKLGDNFIGIERLRLANQGSIKTNIATFIEHLTKTTGAPVVSGIAIGEVSLR
jgi:hypothetical protein